MVTLVCTHGHPCLHSWSPLSALMVTLVCTHGHPSQEKVINVQDGNIHGNRLISIVKKPAYDFNFHNLRGHSLKLKPIGSLSVYSCRYNFFSQRVIKVWNSLPSNVIEATSLNAFKSCLSKIDLSSFCKVYYF